jgi:hypothetical protein
MEYGDAPALSISHLEPDDESFDKELGLLCRRRSEICLNPTVS